MKIAFIVPANLITGGLFVVYHHGHHLVSQGHEVEILFASDAAGTTVTCFPGFNLKTRTLQNALTEQTHFDIVIATWWETYYQLFEFEGRAKHLAYFCQSDERRFYSPGAQEIPLVQATYENRGIHLITEARWIQTWLKEEFGQSAAYAPNGIDTALFNPGVTPVSRRKKAEPKLLLEGPGAVAFKRVAFSFEVAHALKARYPRLQVWYVSSDGIVNPEWKADRVFTAVKMQDMPAIYASCDILLKLSTVEGVFGPPLEMMACGGVAVVSRVSGWNEYIESEKNALAVEIDDRAQATEAVARLLDDSSLRERMIQAGIHTAQQMDWKTVSRFFVEALIKIQAGKPFQAKHEKVFESLKFKQAERVRIAEAAHKVAQAEAQMLASKRASPLGRLKRAWNKMIRVAFRR